MVDFFRNRPILRGGKGLTFLTMLPNTNDLFLEAVNSAVCIEDPADAANVLLQITAALFEVNNFDYARALSQKTFRRIGELDNPKERAYLLRLFVTLLCRRLLIDEAAESLPHIGDPEQRAVALKELAIAQAQVGRLDDALKTADEIEDFDDYEEVLVAVGKEQVRQGLFSEAQTTASQIEAEEPRNRLLRNIAGEESDVTETNISIESAREPDDSFHRSASLRRLGISLHRNGKPSEAVTVFKEALNTVQQIGNTYSRANALTDFAVDLIGLDINGAVKVFRLAVDAAQEIDDISFAIPCLCRIIGCQTTARLFDEAFDTVKVIEGLRAEIPRKSPERSPFNRDFAAVLGKLAVALADSMEFEEESIPLFQKALDIARSIVDAQCRAVALVCLAVTVSEPQ